MPPVAKAIKALRKSAVLRSESLGRPGRGRTPGAGRGAVVANPVNVSMAGGGSSFRIRDAYRNSEVPEAAEDLLIQKPQGSNKPTFFLGRPPSLSTPKTNKASKGDATRNPSRQRPLTQGIQAFAGGGAYPMFIGMGLLGWKFGTKKPKQLPPSSEESSPQALAVRKKESEALAVRNREIKAVDGTRKNLFRNESIKGRVKRFFRGFKYDTPEEAIFIYGLSAVSGAGAGWWLGGAYYVSLGPFLFYTIASSLSLIIGQATSNAIRRRGLLAGVRRIQGNSKEIRKLRGNKIPELDSSDTTIHQSLSNHPKYSLELLAARGLKDASPKKVEFWMNEMFGDDLPAKLQWIRRGKVRGGSQLLIDLLKVGDLTKPEILWIFDTLAILKAEEALLLYDALLYPIEQRDPIISETIRKSFFKKFNALGLSADDIWLAEAQLKYEISGKVEIDERLFRHGLQNKFEQLRVFRVLNLHALPKGYERQLVLIHALESFEKMKKEWEPSEPGYLEMADILVNLGNQKLVEDNIKYWLRQMQENQFYPFLINQAKIVGKAGHREEAVRYLLRAPEVYNRSEGFQNLDMAKAYYLDLGKSFYLDLAKAYFELGLREESRAIAEELLTDPEVDFEAAELMDKLKKGWDEDIPKIGQKARPPYR